jgi:putative endopeptidase
MRPIALTALPVLLALALPPSASARTPAFSPANLDTTCPPCRDFNRFANGGWMDGHSIPEDRSDYGAFEELFDRNQATLHAILDRLAADRKAKPGSDAAKLGDYYSTCMDSGAAERAGIAPIEPLLLAVDSLASAAELAREVAWLHAHGGRALFGFAALQDPRHSERVIAHVGQGGLGLPDRDYYTKEDSASAATRAAYVAHVARSFVLLGRPEPEAREAAARVMEIETALARASMTNVQRRDPVATYHKMPLDSLATLAPRFGWREYLARRRAPAVDSINVQQPAFFRALDGMIASVPLADWRAYLRWKIVDDAAPLLGSAFVDEDFRFQQLLSGAKTLQPRWKRCVRLADQDLGEALGREYVRERFSPAAKARARAMVENLEAALGERLRTLEWMSDSTRPRAIGKLEAFGEKIGYPDHWRDYSTLEIGRASLFENRARARAFEARRQLARIGKPVDRTEWAMTPPTVNAYYSSSLNTINFPAGILQPPFYDPNADDAINYGAIGAVIGHEMTHGFDDRGRQFDGNGNLTDWWTAGDAARYRERAARVVSQFDGYVAVDTLHVNGRLTLGENIADLGGIAVAYAALQKSLAGKPRPPRIDGFTPEQRFFLGWAQVWRGLTRPEMRRTLALTNPHSPDAWRVNGPLSNLAEFARAFGCRAGDPMVRPDSLRATIW